MRRFIPAILFLIPVMLIGVSAYSRGGGQNPANEKAVVELTDSTDVSGVVLQGKYVFEHDYARKLRGEPCMVVYKLTNGQQGEMVTAYHCQPVERPQARATVVTVGLTAQPGIFKLVEVQFAGSTVGHRLVGE